MKQSQLALAALVVTSVLIISFDFTPTKPFISKTFSYSKGSPNQRIEPGYTGDKDPRENSIADSTYTNTANWSEVGNASIPQSSGDVSYINTVTIYNWEDKSNENDEDGVSLQEALNAIFVAYSNNGSLQGLR